jgi:hypothetical protein
VLQRATIASSQAAANAGDRNGLVGTPWTTTLRPNAVCTKRSRSPHQADDYPSASKGRQLAALLLLGPCSCERTGIAHVVPGGLDPAVGTLDVRDAELVDDAIEGIGDAAHMPADAKRS